MPDTVALMQRLRAAGHRAVLPVEHAVAVCRPHRSARIEFMRVVPRRHLFVAREAHQAGPGDLRARVRRFGIEPRESLFIDDFRANVVAARALGWDAVHFLSHEQCEADVAARGLMLDDGAPVASLLPPRGAVRLGAARRRTSLRAPHRVASRPSAGSRRGATAGPS